LLRQRKTASSLKAPQAPPPVTPPHRADKQRVKRAMAVAAPLSGWQRRLFFERGVRFAVGNHSILYAM